MLQNLYCKDRIFLRFLPVDSEQTPRSYPMEYDDGPMTFELIMHQNARNLPNAPKAL